MPLPINDIPTPIIGIDANGVIVAANQQACQLFGYDQLEGLLVDLLVPQRYRDKHPELRTSYVAAPVARPMAEDRCLFGVRQDGVELRVRIALLPLEGVFYAFIFDLTTIQAKNDELSRANADLEQFAYAASHDLQEPLRSISGYVQLIGKRYRDKVDADGQMYFDRATKAVHRLQGLIEDLLLYSRSGSNTPHAPTRLHECAREAVDALAGKIAEVNATVEIHELPTLNVSKSQVTQIFQNLIANAIKFQPDEQSPHVTIRPRGANGIEVTDNGIGIEADHRSKVFKVFSRLSDNYIGSGIGLAIVKRIMDRHSGTVSIEARADGLPGSVFVLQFGA